MAKRAETLPRMKKGGNSLQNQPQEECIVDNLLSEIRYLDSYPPKFKVITTIIVRYISILS